MDLLRERRDAIEVLTLNRPESANSLNTELNLALIEALAEIDRDDRVRVVVLTGSGDRHFCAGLDLREAAQEDIELSSIETDVMTPDRREQRELFRHPCEKPLVAAVNGVAVGGGFELVLASDLVVAAEGARFGLPEVRRGLLAGGGGTLLGTRIPLNLALEMALTGEFVEASRLAHYGLVNRVVPAPILMDSALALAESIAKNAPRAVRTTKAMMRRAVLEGAELGWGTDEELARVFHSDDAREGAVAFLEKRTPVWKNR